ncbi:MAG TPA: helix-turn-helix domain-containing protein [Candidatus Sulfopaludibacter sp.]|nr:helix-turn-helix domain-containing protein [Candidatus Sulfopaludibacter sp.]
MEDPKVQFMLEETACKSCPVNNTFNIIGKKFAILILRNMIILKQKRFNEFLDSIEKINPKTLSVRLKEMEKDKIIKREVYNEKPVRIEYSLTKKGEALKPILEQMAIFSMKYCCEQIFENPKSVRLDKLESDPFKKYRIQT